MNHSWSESMSLGEMIRRQREMASLPMRQLAAMAGISNPYLSQIERGLRDPSDQVLNAIADSLQTLGRLPAAAARGTRPGPRPTRRDQRDPIRSRPDGPAAKGAGGVVPGLPRSDHRTSPDQGTPQRCRPDRRVAHRPPRRSPDDRCGRQAARPVMGRGGTQAEAGADAGGLALGRTRQAGAGEHLRGPQPGRAPLLQHPARPDGRGCGDPRLHPHRDGAGHRTQPGPAGRDQVHHRHPACLGHRRGARRRRPDRRPGRRRSATSGSRTPPGRTMPPSGCSARSTSSGSRRSRNSSRVPRSTTTLRVKVAFLTQAMVDAVAPTNSFATNPDAMRRAIETGGLSVVKGAQTLPAGSGREQRHAAAVPQGRLRGRQEPGRHPGQGRVPQRPDGADPVQPDHRAGVRDPAAVQPAVDQQVLHHGPLARAAASCSGRSTTGTPCS